MKTVLVSVLASNEPPYRKMTQTSMETWDSFDVPGVRTVFFAGKPQEPDTDRHISFPVDESYHNINQKNVFAFAKSLEWDWDYMARVNSSCYVHKRRLLQHVQLLSETGVARGVMTPATWVCGIDRPFLWGGGQFVFSRDVVQAMHDNISHLRHDLMEDVAITELLRHCGFEPQSTGPSCSINKTPEDWTLISNNSPSPSFSFIDWKEINNAPDQFFFRVKHDPDRAVDEIVMKALAKHLTP